MVGKYGLTGTDHSSPLAVNRCPFDHTKRVLPPARDMWTKFLDELKQFRSHQKILFDNDFFQPVDIAIMIFASSAAKILNVDKHPVNIKIGLPFQDANTHHIWKQTGNNTLTRYNSYQTTPWKLCFFSIYPSVPSYTHNIPKTNNEKTIVVNDLLEQV